MEGYAGSAIQSKVLSDFKQVVEREKMRGVHVPSLVFVHALNAFGENINFTAVN